MPNCTKKPSNLKHQIDVVKAHLVKNYGTKKFYSIDEVKAANRHNNIQSDYVCWSHVLFNSHADFAHFHSQLGQDCDYKEMKSTLLSDISASSNDPSWIDLDLSWLDLSKIDFPDLNPFS